MLFRAAEGIGRKALGATRGLGRTGVFLAAAVRNAVVPPYRGRDILKQIHFIGVKSLFVIVLTAAVAPHSDFREMAKRSLGIYWKDRSPSERVEFTRLYQDLPENSYAGKIESYQGEKILYGKETVDPPYAGVRTFIVTTKGQEIPVNYLLLQKSSFPELMRKLKATIGRQEKG